MVVSSCSRMCRRSVSSPTSRNSYRGYTPERYSALLLGCRALTAGEAMCGKLCGACADGDGATFVPLWARQTQRCEAPTGRAWTTSPAPNGTSQIGGISCFPFAAPLTLPISIPSQLLRSSPIHSLGVVFFVGEPLQITESVVGTVTCKASRHTSRSCVWKCSNCSVRLTINMVTLIAVHSTFRWSCIDN